MRPLLLAAELWFRFISPIGGVLLGGVFLFFALGWLPGQSAIPAFHTELAVVAGVCIALSLLLLILANLRKARDGWRSYVIPDERDEGGDASGHHGSDR